MNKVQRNAKAYEKLLDIEYVFCLSYNGKGKTVVLRFVKEDFSHLEGIGQLVDLPFYKKPSRELFKMALAGEISEEDLQKSKNYEKHFINRKVDHLYLLEEFIDNNDIVFNYIHKHNKQTSIQAKIFLYKDMSGKDIYLFLDSRNNDECYYGRSFVVEPDINFQAGQHKYTVLWKEKRNTKTGESEVLYQHGNFTPEQLKE